MRGIYFGGVLYMGLLAACNSQETAGEDPEVAAAPADCLPPTLRLEEGEELPDGLKQGGADLAKLEDAFARGYSAACSVKFLAADGLKDAAGNVVRELTVHNAPSANVVAIYRSEEGQMVLEVPLFMPESGRIAIPEPVEVQEALFCYAVGPAEEEVQRSGRCLPD